VLLSNHIFATNRFAVETKVAPSPSRAEKKTAHHTGECKNASQKVTPRYQKSLDEDITPSLLIIQSHAVLSTPRQHTARAMSEFSLQTKD